MHGEYDEPESLPEILAKRPSRRVGPGKFPPDFEERLEGAWVGRPLGCRTGRQGEDRDPRSLVLKAALGEALELEPEPDPSPEGPLAALRAEAYGYLYPGRPETAAVAAFSDASKTHVRNGIYAAMCAAASNAWALVAKDPYEIVEAGLSQIPQGSRLLRSARLAVSLVRADLEEAEIQTLLAKNMSDLPRLHAVRLIAESVASFLGAGDRFSRSAAGGPLSASWAGARLGLRAIPLVLRTSPEGVLRTGFAEIPEMRVADLMKENLRWLAQAGTE